MTEAVETGQLTLPSFDIIRPPHDPIVFPDFLKTDRRWLQLPPGNIVYAEAKSSDKLPDTVKMLDQQGNPVFENGHEWERPFDEPSRVPAVVLHTGPRTPKNSYDRIIAEARLITTRERERDSMGKIKAFHQGFVVIVEDKIKGGDTNKEWREQQLTNLDLVKDVDGPELTVIETDEYFITFGRVAKEHYVPDFIKDRYKPQEERIKTPQQLLDEKNRALTKEFKKEGKLAEVELSDCCGDCGQHYKYVYFQENWVKKKENVIVELLKGKKVCNSGRHRNIREIIIGTTDKIGYLGSHRITR